MEQHVLNTDPAERFAAAGVGFLEAMFAAIPDEELRTAILKGHSFEDASRALFRSIVTDVRTEAGKAECDEMSAANAAQVLSRCACLQLSLLYPDLDLSAVPGWKHGPIRKQERKKPQSD